MKTFKPTYLYVKTHNVTGLKYFGKTTSNRKRYRGSGHYWIRHINKHGYDVTTEIVGYFTEQDKCVKFATEFSISNNIVESKEWANERIENGLDGGDTTSSKSKEDKYIIVNKRKETISRKSSEELAEINRKNSDGVKQYIKENPKIRQAATEKIVESRRNNGKPWHSEETRKNIGKNSKSGTDEVRQQISKTLTGRKNPEHSKRMSQKTGLSNKNTRVFEVINPNGESLMIIGCEALAIFCKDNKLAYEQFTRHVNAGKIEKILAKRPRPEMRNCLDYEIKEIGKKTLDINLK
jgi:hypothetical protein